MHGKGKTAPRVHHAHPNTLYFHCILTFSCNLRVWQRMCPVSAKALVFSRHLHIHGVDDDSERWHDVDIVHMRHIQPAALPGLFMCVLFQCTCDVTDMDVFWSMI